MVAISVGLLLANSLNITYVQLASFPGSPRTQTKNKLQVAESWADPGNEANVNTTYVLIKIIIIVRLMNMLRE